MATSKTFPVKAGELVNYAIAEHIENAGRASPKKANDKHFAPPGCTKTLPTMG